MNSAPNTDFIPVYVNFENNDDSTTSASTSQGKCKQRRVDTTIKPPEAAAPKAANESL